MFSEQGKGDWTFAACVAQCGANSLKNPKANKMFVLHFIFVKKSLLEPQPTPRPFRAPYGRTSAASPAKEDLVGPELPPADEIRKSKKVALTENIVQGEEEHLGDPRQCV